MLRPFLIASTLIAGSTAMSVHAQQFSGYTVPADATVLSISVQAEASQAPDIATLSAGVVTQAVEGDAALRENAQRMTRVVAAIRAAGIDDKDVQTSGVHLSPQYRYGNQQAPTITGFQASNTVTVKVRDIARLGEVMDALAADGANQIHGPNFGIDEPEPVYDRARRRAVALARSRAATYADSLDLRVRRIVSINEGGGGVQPMPMMAMAKMDAATESTPVMPGENTVSVNLEVVFELGR